MASSLRAPFIVTVGISSLATGACSGKAVIDDAGGGGSSATASGSGGAISASVSNGSGGTTSTSSSTGGGNDPACPETAPGSYEQCTLSPSIVCRYTVDCQSGAQSIPFRCGEYSFWETAPEKCTPLYDSCPGTELYCQGTWFLPMATNPPSPCPPERPNEGDACYSGGFGGVWEKCGYPCGDDPSSGWTIATCPFDPSGTMSTWTLDGACDP